MNEGFVSEFCGYNLNFEQLILHEFVHFPNLNIENIVFGVYPEDFEIEAGSPFVAHVSREFLAAIDSPALSPAADVSRLPVKLGRSVSVGRTTFQEENGK